MTRGEILVKSCRAHQHILAERLGKTGLALFRSFARDEATDASKRGPKLVTHDGES